MPFVPKRFILAGAAALWLLITGLGFWALTARSFKPGASGAPGSVWPADSRLQRNVGGFTLVMALHPECPCSQASLDELDSIMARCGGRLSVRVLCEPYDTLSEPVERSPSWRRAQEISGVVIIKDSSGAEVRRFAAETSGETRLYGPAGELLFHGGITGSRGHVGDNPGQAAVLDFVLHGAQARALASAPVFGCAL
jgi:hypothetical protein